MDEASSIWSLAFCSMIIIINVLLKKKKVCICLTLLFMMGLNTVVRSRFSNFFCVSNLIL